LDFFRRRGSASGDDLGGSEPEAEPLLGTILFVSVSAAPDKLATEWAEDCDKIILRRCPVCEHDSIIGHGLRRKQAHDEHHSWIGIRRGRCPACKTTFTFLPLFSLPYTHFSLFARCQALWLRFREHCSWEAAMPRLKNADRLPDASTVRRWSRGLDYSEPAVSFVRQTMACVARWLQRGNGGNPQISLLPWMWSALKVLWPLRL